MWAAAAHSAESVLLSEREEGRLRLWPSLRPPLRGWRIYEHILANGTPFHVLRLENCDPGGKEHCGNGRADRRAAQPLAQARRAVGLKPA